MALGPKANSFVCETDGDDYLMCKSGDVDLDKSFMREPNVGEEIVSATIVVNWWFFNQPHELIKDQGRKK